MLQQHSQQETEELVVQRGRRQQLAPATKSGLPARIATSHRAGPVDTEFVRVLFIPVGY